MSEAKKMYAKANAGSVKTNGAVNHLPAALAHGKAGLFIFPILEGTKDQPLIKQWGRAAETGARGQSQEAVTASSSPMAL